MLDQIGVSSDVVAVSVGVEDSIQRQVLLLQQLEDLPSSPLTGSTVDQQNTVAVASDEADVGGARQIGDAVEHRNKRHGLLLRGVLAYKQLYSLVSERPKKAATSPPSVVVAGRFPGCTQRVALVWPWKDDILATPWLRLCLHDEQRVYTLSCHRTWTTQFCPVAVCSIS